MQTAAVYILDYEEFEKLVNTHLPFTFTYSVVADEEWNNDSDHYYSKLILETLDKYDEIRLSETYQGKTRPHFASWILLQTLVNMGILPEGNYLIRVCW